MRLDDIDFELPERLIAQQPLSPRDSSRLLHVDRRARRFEHRAFRDLPTLLRAGDLLVVNDSRVLPARLFGRKPTGGEVELLLLRELAPARWEALVRPSRRLRCCGTIEFGDLAGTLVARLGEGRWELEFQPAERLPALLASEGRMPLPPYIHDRLDDPERYQTVYSDRAGSAAAPTAGLHFTTELLAELAARGIGRAAVTLHVGLDTFRPVQAERVEDHPMHSEAWCVPAETAAQVAATKSAGGRVIAVGTTSVRALETASESGEVRAGAGWTRLFITPGYRFRAVDAMITNFHLPRTTLFAMVGAFAGLELMREAYQTAFAESYRLLSFGDAMLLE